VTRVISTTPAFAEWATALPRGKKTQEPPQWHAGGGTQVISGEFSDFRKSSLGHTGPLANLTAYFCAHAALLHVPLGSLYAAGKEDFDSGMTFCGANDEGEG
jgi:hypothetical protein